MEHQRAVPLTEVRVGTRTRRIKLALFMTFLFVFGSAPFLAPASAQAPAITASPGYINFGMTTTISATAPSTGSYTISVQPPTGAAITLTSPLTAGQTESLVFGSSTSGFLTLVNQVGTYNVFFEQGTTVIGATSFYATNQIIITTDFISADYCDFMNTGSRGEELLFQIHATYLSTGQPIAITTNATSGANNAATNGDVVTYTLPGNGGVATASFHAAEAAAWPVPWFQGHVWGAWNATWVGNYYPVVTATDKWGNTGTYNGKTVGYAFVYSPATLQTSLTLNDNTGKLIPALSSDQSVTITANVQYNVQAQSGISSIGVVSGTNGPLTAGTTGNNRGGVVIAQVGYGYYNTTTNAFTSIKNEPGGMIATVTLAYSTTTKLWTGTFNTGTLPNLVNSSAYTIVVSSHDDASPPNTGFYTMSVQPLSAMSMPTVSAAAGTSTVTATAPPSTITATVAASTVTATAPPSTVVSTATVTSGAVTSTLTSTAVSTLTSTSTAISTLVSVAVSTLTSTISAVPGWAYAAFLEGMILFLIVGLAAGYVIRRQRKKAPA